MKKFRANFLTLPYGVAYLPIPRPETYSLVVGNPIEVPHIPDPAPEIIETFITTTMLKSPACSTNTVPSVITPTVILL